MSWMQASLLTCCLVALAGCKDDGDRCLVATGDTDVEACERACADFNAKKAYRQPLCCERLGTVYERGIKVKADRRKAGEYYQKACKMGSNLACTSLQQLRGRPAAQGLR